MALYLASTSPRRQTLLRAAAINFELVPPGPEPRSHGAPADRARARAHSKAVHASVEGPAGWVLGVDTVVVCDDRELGKPADRAAAAAMLGQLSGQTHEVVTAVCLRAHPEGAVIEEAATAQVQFGELSAEDIERYLESGDWRGKAGAYGIQDASCDFATLVGGDRDTVVGLPVALLSSMIARAESTP